jgi:preprotein translocase subunit SecG
MLIAALGQYFFGIAIFISSLFLILLVLVQRGRGGGLTGALGGPGGQSAFGTKAGDLFTRITIGVAAVWILLCAVSVVLLKSRGLPTLGPGAGSAATVSGFGPPADEQLDTGGVPAVEAESPLSSPSGLETPSAVPGTETTEGQESTLPDSVNPLDADASTQSPADTDAGLEEPETATADEAGRSEGDLPTDTAAPG